ncbi:ABC transporter substrate-binding protein [Acinetobacter sp.]|uniref:ABC transporter substrate-binding protein n=1 Tax=Acinetobacter sp. TaxID=472 RepID=UPI0028B0EF4C|nr:ABC transporter substrate-binding protein [Acinetobacter sp.]
MQKLEKTDIQLGYIPLLDCVALLWAEHQGYFAEQGLNVTLTQEPSWASLRDRLAFGFLDAAHCLSAMLPASVTGKDHLGIPLQTSMTLSTNCAYISLSQKLCYKLNIHALDLPKNSAEKIVSAIKQNQTIQLAHVFQHSIHHYILREWLALADTEIAQTQTFSTLPPPYMVEAISTQRIDGFCVGEPWNTQAEIQGYSRIIVNSQDIIEPIPDKVLAFTHDWAEKHPNTLKAIHLAIQKAQNDLLQQRHFSEIFSLLKQYHIIRFDCSEQIHVEAFHRIKRIIQNFGKSQAPQTSDFEWMIQKMQQYDQLNIEDEKVFEIAQSCIYQDALG